MAYVGSGSDIPSAAQPPGTPQNMQMQYAIAKALLGNQPQFMQSRLQPLAQIANTGLAAKLMNDAKAQQLQGATQGLGMDPTAAAAGGAGGGNPFSSLFSGIFGGGNGP